MPAAEGPPAAKRRSRWLDRIIGVVLGLVLGIGVITFFVFESSEDTIDAARISGIDNGQPGPGPSQGGARVPLVKVIDGKPPASGPVQLDFKQGQKAQFVVGSDQPLTIEVPGYGVSRTIEQGRTLVAFRARMPGQYPVVVSATKIDVAILQVGRQ